VRRGIALPDGLVDFIMDTLIRDKGLELANYIPKFLVDQVMATCRFMGQTPHFEPRFVEYAINNLKVRRHSPLPAPVIPAVAV